MEATATTPTKALNVTVSPEVHKAAKLLCVQRGITQAKLIEQLVLQAATGEAKSCLQ